MLLLLAVNGFNKSDKDTCEWAFLSAILELQERAQREGSNAVVELRVTIEITNAVAIQSICAAAVR